MTMQDHRSVNLSNSRAEPATLRDSYVQTGRVPLGRAIRLGLRDFFVQPFWLPIKYLPGVVGMKLRQWIYRLRLGRMGRHSLLDVGVEAYLGRNIEIGEFTLIDKYVHLNASQGHIVIGDRCHLAPLVIVLGHGGVVIEDYVGVGPGARILSVSEWPGQGKRMAGPMVPAEQRGLKIAPVRLGRNSFIGANAVILPGITIGEGAVVGANSLVGRDVPPWSVVLGVPAITVGQREPVADGGSPSATTAGEP